MPDVTVGSTPLVAPLVELVRLDFSPESAADAWHRIATFWGEYLQ